MYGMTNSEKLFADELTEWLLEVGFINHIVRCLSIISMHQMDLKLLSYLMLMILSFGIQMKILENGLLILWDIDPCELLGICTLVHFNQNFSYEGTFHFFGSG